MVLIPTGKTIHQDPHRPIMPRPPPPYEYSDHEKQPDPRPLSPYQNGLSPPRLIDLPHSQPSMQRPQHHGQPGDPPAQARMQKPHLQSEMQTSQFQTQAPPFQPQAHRQHETQRYPQRYPNIPTDIHRHSRSTTDRNRIKMARTLHTAPRYRTKADIQMSLAMKTMMISMAVGVEDAVAIGVVIGAIGGIEATNVDAA